MAYYLVKDRFVSDGPALKREWLSMVAKEGLQVSSVDPNERSLRTSAASSDDGAWEDILGNEADDEDGEKSAPEQRNAERLLRLFHLINVNACSQQQILDHLRDYYPSDVEDDGQTRATRNPYWRVRRDIIFLQRMGYVIEKTYDASKTVYYRLRAGSGPVSSSLFTDQELTMLAMLYTLLIDPDELPVLDAKQPLSTHVWRHPFGQDILRLIERLTEGLAPSQKKIFEQRVRKPVVYLYAETVTDYTDHRRTIEVIMQAITGRRQLWFEYLSNPFEQGATIHPQVDAYYLVQQDGHLYLIGYSADGSSAYKNRVFEWRVDRIKGETIKMQSGTVSSIQQRPRLITFHYWADASIAKGGLSRRWVTHEIEREETTGQGRRRFLIRAQATSEWRILQQLHKYGDKVELVDPPKLREQMKGEVKRMYDLYFN